MSLEKKVKEMFKEILDIDEGEIVADKPFDASLGLDSTEMVEILVALKKEFGIELQTNEFKKGQTFNELVEFLEKKGAK